MLLKRNKNRSDRNRQAEKLYKSKTKIIADIQSHLRALDNGESLFDETSKTGSTRKIEIPFAIVLHHHSFPFAF